MTRTLGAINQEVFSVRRIKGQSRRNLYPSLYEKTPSTTLPRVRSNGQPPGRLILLSVS